MLGMTILLLGLIGLASTAGADPTWPSDIDDLEEVMYQVFGFRARGFADTVSPCDTEASGPGRFNSAEFLRTGFHDVAPANVSSGIGGLDASLQYELENGENGGSAFETTLRFMSPFVNKKTSLADLIALGVYTSVRSCGGPAIPVRHGRVDATSMGPRGVPRVQDSVSIFKQQFHRMGFSAAEMVQLVACGHTIGGVHSSTNPDIVPLGTTPLDVRPLDSTPAVFDRKIVADYLDGTSENPLIRGPAVALNQHSDFRIFNSDSNQTVSAMDGTAAFHHICRNVLGRMIDVIPAHVRLTAPIEPYNIRVRTTQIPLEDISSLTVTYHNRLGRPDCGGPCSFTVGREGVENGTGFDDTFAFFPISRDIPASSGISSFTVSINKRNGSSMYYDNNGKSYPMQDGIVIQKRQSCLREKKGILKLSVAVRSDIKVRPITASIAYKTPQKDSPVPLLKEMYVGLYEGKSRGNYTLFSGKIAIPGGLSSESMVDIIGGTYKEGFRHVDEVGESCRLFDGLRPHPSAVPIGTSTASGGNASSTVSEVAASPTRGEMATSVSEIIVSDIPGTASGISSNRHWRPRETLLAVHQQVEDQDE
ncbi:related to beta-1,3 exoglucanase precursor [Cephalotrichum gorgonifer]|uniref:Peroxidase n=1 Tax=Cephalotrichum gorgonifer TaxID=2041049 RepID=A0AAE8SSP2_9PEZI|nr:related to beta-1,3 exoglucanase precursor [Cephalotrichum gorgonifer]